jgi:diguanylate cyclase (GGDEF)-like protein/PAS domain S-box-containing protein
MKPAPLPENETVRLRALREFDVLDTPPDPAFDDITALAAHICKRPMALVSLVDADRQWFKSRRGLDVDETPRDVAFCSHAILNTDEVMVVHDAREDERFADNPLVTGPPYLRFYAGAPLVTAGGEAVGTVCVLDREPGEMSLAEIEALRRLARQARALLELRRGEIGRLRSELEEARHRIKTCEAKPGQFEQIENAARDDRCFREAITELSSEGVCVFHSVPSYPFMVFSVWNPQMIEITGYTMDEINRIGWHRSLFPDPEAQQKVLARMRAGENLRAERWELRHPDGSKRTLTISTSRLTPSDGRERVLALMHDFTEAENYRREALLGRKDALTGVLNRRAFKDETAKLLKLAARTGSPSAVGFLDLDDLKIVNDSMGHAEGDRVLEGVGEALRKLTRCTDIVGRLGGDEFAIFLPDTGLEGARVFFDRLHQRLTDAIRNHGWPVGTSAGVAVFPDGQPSESEALRCADRLMYEAKKIGKNRVIYREFPAWGASESG